MPRQEEKGSCGFHPASVPSGGDSSSGNANSHELSRAFSVFKTGLSTTQPNDDGTTEQKVGDIEEEKKRDESLPPKAAYNPKIHNRKKRKRALVMEKSGDGGAAATAFDFPDDDGDRNRRDKKVTQTKNPYKGLGKKLACCKVPGCTNIPRRFYCDAHRFKGFRECRHPGCTKSQQAKGFCRVHGGKPDPCLWQKGDVQQTGSKGGREHVEDCLSLRVRRGLCMSHYSRAPQCDFAACTGKALGHAPALCWEHHPTFPSLKRRSGPKPGHTKRRKPPESSADASVYINDRVGESERKKKKKKENIKLGTPNSSQLSSLTCAESSCSESVTEEGAYCLQHDGGGCPVKSGSSKEKKKFKMKNKKRKQSNLLPADQQGKMVQRRENKGDPKTESYAKVMPPSRLDDQVNRCRSGQEAPSPTASSQTGPSSTSTPAPRQQRQYYCAEEGCKEEVVKEGLLCFRHSALGRKRPGNSEITIVCAAPECTMVATSWETGRCRLHGPKVVTVSGMLCGVGGCKSGAEKGGLCLAHHLEGLPPCCPEPGCTRRVAVKGRCRKHYRIHWEAQRTQKRQKEEEEKRAALVTAGKAGHSASTVMKRKRGRPPKDGNIPDVTTGRKRGRPPKKKVPAPVASSAVKEVNPFATEDVAEEEGPLPSLASQPSFEGDKERALTRLESKKLPSKGNKNRKKLKRLLEKRRQNALKSDGKKTLKQDGQERHEELTRKKNKNEGDMAKIPADNMAVLGSFSTCPPKSIDDVALTFSVKLEEAEHMTDLAKILRSGDTRFLGSEEVKKEEKKNITQTPTARAVLPGVEAPATTKDNTGSLKESNLSPVMEKTSSLPSWKGSLNPPLPSVPTSLSITSGHKPIQFDAGIGDGLGLRSSTSDWTPWALDGYDSDERTLLEEGLSAVESKAALDISEGLTTQRFLSSLEGDLFFA